MSNNTHSHTDLVKNLEGAHKVNNFLRRKEQEAREEADSASHQVTKLELKVRAEQEEARALRAKVMGLQVVIRGMRGQMSLVGSNGEDMEGGF